MKGADFMKELIVIFMCFAMCLSFVGCNNTNNQEGEMNIPGKTDVSSKK